MFRSALVWTLLAAFLATVPVTGAGRCPCRFVKAPGKTAAPVAPTTALPQACKGCCQARHDKAPERPCGERQMPPCPHDGPSDAPCDHKFVADAAPTAERSQSVGGIWDADAVTGVDERPTSYFSHAPAADPDRPMPTPATSRDALRYAHAFRS